MIPSSHAGTGAVLRFGLFNHALLVCLRVLQHFLNFAQLASSINSRKAPAPEGTEKGYFMVGLSAAICLVGRWLEPWLVRR